MTITEEIATPKKSKRKPLRGAIREGTLKKNLNDPPNSPRPPAPKAQVAPRSKKP
jgi:hypothetical protein